jgi:hypothetical protein
MLARSHGCVRHGVVEIVGRTDVDHAHVSIGDQILVIASGSLDAKAVCKLPRRLGGTSGNTNYFNVAQAAQRLGMDTAHEADPKNCNFWLFQITFQSSPAPRGDRVYDVRARRSRIKASFPMNSWGT